MTQTYNPPTSATSRGDRLTLVVLLLAWAALSWAALGFVLVFGANVPYADEWEFVPTLTGHEPVGPWLWTQHNEHRLPLPRLIYLVLFRITHDFRAGMVLQLLMLSALSFYLMRHAEKLRGRPHWADVFFPVSLLHIGHWENFLMGYQLCFTLFTVLVMSIGVVALRTTRETAFRNAASGGVLALLLSLCGGFGIVAALPVCAWIAYLGIGMWRTEARWKCVLLFVLAVLPVAYLGLYRIEYVRPEHHPEPGAGGVRVIAITTGETLAMAFGIGAETLWPVVCLGMLVLGVGTIAVLLRKGGTDIPVCPGRQECLPHQASLGLIAVAAGVAGLALAIGVGRSGFPNGEGGFYEDMGLWSRYSLLTWPLIGLAYLAWVKRGNKWVPLVICVAAALLFQMNVQVGLRYGTGLRERHEGIAEYARTGMPASWIVERYLPGTGQEERALRGIPMLREAKIGPFAGK